MMEVDRRKFLSLVAATFASSTGWLVSSGEARALGGLPNNKHLRIILNNDLNNLLWASSGGRITLQEYTRGVEALLQGKPVVLAQNVGLPDPVIYRSKEATSLAKHIVDVSLKTEPWVPPFGQPTAERWVRRIEKERAETRRDAEVQADAMRRLEAFGTDPLALTIEVCRRRGVFAVASYRMNSNDWYQNTWLLSDFGRAHPQSRIPNTGALDLADPAVYEHRQRIFREVVENYDTDGIEFDYMRGLNMVLNPRENYPIVTHEVADTRRMLDEVARRKRRTRLLLGVRVGYSLDGPSLPPDDLSCRDRGLDVRTWVRKGLVDYVCPSYYWPRLPGVPKTAEFAALARHSHTGVYPTIFPFASWQDAPLDLLEEPHKTRIDEDDLVQMGRLKNEICGAALQAYAEGADGVSTFNWVHHHQPGMVYHPMRADWGLGSKKVQMWVHPKLGSPRALRECLNQSVEQARETHR